MGKSTQLKQQEKAAAEYALMSSFKDHNKKVISTQRREKASHVPVVNKILAYESHFIKDGRSYTLRTKSKDVDKQLLEIVRFSFNKYSVCNALSNAWTVAKQPSIFLAAENGVAAIDFKKWYICVAQGGSLYKEHAKEYLSKKEVHNLTTCPHELSIEQAIVYSIAKAENKNEGIALRIARSNLNKKILTPFWKSVIRFFAKYTPENIQKINDLLDFFHHKVTQEANFSMSGQTLEVLNKKMTDWHYELRRTKVLESYSWAGIDLPNEQFITTNQRGDEIIWEIKQILTGKELAKEGNTMHHCVYSYKDKCIKGDCSIWSLTLTEYGATKPKVTIELSRNRYITQARGFANRGLKNDEKHILNQWTKKANLNFAGYY